MLKKILSISACAAMVISLLAGCGSSGNKGVWEKYENNPVVGNDETGTTFDVDVIQLPDSTYRMYISWRPEKAIAISESKDGETWSDMQIVLESNENSGWEDDINRSSTLVYNNIYYMYYTGQVVDYATTGFMSGSSCIGLAYSMDGINFERFSDGPLLVPELDWEGDSIMNPCVIYDDEDSKFKMWYAAGEQYEPDVLGYAESEDGIVWNKHPEPVYGPTDKWYEKEKVGGCDVVKTKDGYIMFYIGYENVDNARICVAKSPNGIDQWVESADNPIVSPDEGAWDSEACYKPTVIYNKKKDLWMLWYNGRTEDREYVGYVTHKGYDLNWESSQGKQG